MKKRIPNIARNIGAASLLVAVSANNLYAGSDTVDFFEPGFVVPTIPGFESVAPVTPITTATTVSRPATRAIVKSLQSSQELCKSIGQAEYVPDCIGDQLAQIAKALPKTGDYAEAQKALEDASVKFRGLARTNASPTLPRIKVTSKTASRPVQTSALVPVETSELASVNQQAQAILDETVTILLRSAANSERRKVHYQQIAQAVGSNKSLLRSL